MLCEQVLEFCEQLLGHHRRTPKLAKVRNDSPLRFNVTLALGNVALRHFQFGLTVHSWNVTLNRAPPLLKSALRPWGHLKALLARRGLYCRRVRDRLLHPEPLLRRRKHFLEPRIVADRFEIWIGLSMPNPGRARYRFEERLEGIERLCRVIEPAEECASSVVAHD